MSHTHTARRLELTDAADDPMALRTTFALFPSGIAAVSAIVDNEPVVLVASSFQVGISADPPLVLFAVQHTSTSWPRLKTRDRVGVSVLGEAHDSAARQLSSKTAQRFDGIPTTALESGALLIDGAPVHLECSIHSEVSAGDHDVVLLHVHAMSSTPETDPLIWHGSAFRALVPHAAT